VCVELFKKRAVKKYHGTAPVPGEEVQRNRGARKLRKELVEASISERSKKGGPLPHEEHGQLKSKNSNRKVGIFYGRMEGGAANFPGLLLGEEGTQKEKLVARHARPSQREVEKERDRSNRALETKDTRMLLRGLISIRKERSLSPRKRQMEKSYEPFVRDEKGDGGSAG